MKYLIFFLLFLPVLATAQRVKTSETSAVRYGLNPRTGDSTWYEIRTIEYDDGAIDIIETTVVDTARLVNFAATSAVDNLKKSTFHVNGWWRDAAAIGHALQVEALLSQPGRHQVAVAGRRQPDNQHLPRRGHQVADAELPYVILIKTSQ